MSDIAIRVEDLGKLYRIGKLQQRHDTLREALVDLNPLPRIARIVGREESDDSRQEDTIWALKDVSFEVKRGEVVGIIGRNGAGKSTLLKILSRITEPTEGRAEIRGRVGSLLEVGTGFHPELTGRENIYLSGAILGMSRAEIERKFDEIVDFSGVEKFIDTPIKRYSSGMNVRLGFAVAAHLEPEILLVDEVLAVGDAAFQKKCLGKMGELAEEGRTVLFVSHNMAAVQTLTGAAICLREGRVSNSGKTRQVVSSYLSWLAPGARGASVDLVQLSTSPNRTQVLKRFEVLAGGCLSDHIPMGETISFRISYEASQPILRPRLGIVIESYSGMAVVSFGTVFAGFELPHLLGRGFAVCDTGRLPLNSGTYYARVVLGQVDGSLLEDYQRALEFQVLPSGLPNATRILDSERLGHLAWQSKWHLESSV